MQRIGGSEFSIILDCNPYNRRIDLVLEKAGVIASTFEGNSATRRGERLESKVIEMFEQETGLKITNQQREFKKRATKNHLALVCHVDGLANDDSVFEAKTTDYKANTWKDGIPIYYKKQLEFNCYLSKKKQAYIAVAFCKDDEVVDFKWFLYKPTMSEDEIIAACIGFTNEVEEYKKLGIINNGQIIDSDFDDSLIEELNGINEEIAKIKIQLKPYEERKKQIEDKLKKVIGNNSGLQTDLYKITLGNIITSPKTTYGISRGKLKVEYKKEN